MKQELWQIDAPHFCAGCVSQSIWITFAAPIIKYMKGWTIEKMKIYCEKKGWKVEHVS